MWRITSPTGTAKIKAMMATDGMVKGASSFSLPKYQTKNKCIKAVAATDAAILARNNDRMHRFAAKVVVRMQPANMRFSKTV